MSEPSKNWLGACPGCGAGIIRRDTPHGHALWCPTIDHDFARLLASGLAGSAYHNRRHAALVSRGHYFLSLRRAGYSVGKIAAQTGWSESAVYRAMHTAEHEPVVPLTR